MIRFCMFCILALTSCFTPTNLLGFDPSVVSNRVLIVHDELPQMEVLTRFLQEKGDLDVTLVEQ